MTAAGDGNGRAAPPNAFRAARWAPLLVVAATLFAYWNSLFTDFVFDDVHGILENEAIRTLWPPWRLLDTVPGSLCAGRPLVTLTFALNFAVEGAQATRGYHLTNLAIHVAAALTLYGLARRALSASLGAGSAPDGTALSIALLWAVHPLQTESVTYISTRTESLMGLFYFLTVYALARAAAPAARARPWKAASLLFCLMAMASKETAVTAPMAALLYDRTFLSGRFSTALRRRPRYHAALAALALLSAAYALAGPRRPVATFETTALVENALLQCEVFLHYLRLSLWPAPLVVDYYGWPTPGGLADALPEALAAGGLAVGALVLFARRAPLGFPALWTFLTLAPTSLVPMPAEVAAERRMYLPLAGVVALAVIAGRAALARRAASGARLLGVARRALVWGAALALALVTIDRNYDYMDNRTLWEDAVRKRPQNPRAHANLGAALAGAMDNRAAERHYREAIRLAPDAAIVHANLGHLLAGEGRYAEALEAFREALARDPASPALRSQIASAMERQGDERGAAAAYREAIERNPDALAPATGLALLLAGAKDPSVRDPAAALAVARAAHAAHPRSPEALHALAAALAAAGRPEEAADAAHAAADLARRLGRRDLARRAEAIARRARAPEPR